MADPLYVLSLFSGIGGLDVGVHAGLRRLGYTPRPVCYVEREAFCAAVLAQAMERGQLAPGPIWLGSVDEPRLPRADLVVAGFPCPPVSQAGKRRGIHDERWLWPSIARVLDDSGASLLFLENVRGLLTANGGDAFGSILSSLAERGFDAEWCVLRASDVGAPHQRARVFLLAHRTGERPQQHSEQDGRAEDDGTPRRDNARGCSPAVVHTDGQGREGRGLPDSGRPDERAARPPGSEMGDSAEFSQREQDDTARPDARRLSREDACGTSFWPPGPDDLDGWRDVLTRDPYLASALEPALRGVADGLPDELHVAAMEWRLDRLRALGNACVPLQAEVAFVLLWRRMFDGGAP